MEDEQCLQIDWNVGIAIAIREEPSVCGAEGTTVIEGAEEAARVERLACGRLKLLLRKSRLPEGRDGVETRVPLLDGEVTRKFVANLRNKVGAAVGAEASNHHIFGES